MGVISDTGRTLDQIEAVPYEQAFLISDLLTTNITMLSGEPKAGKSLLAAAMATTLINGHSDFLGLPVHQRLDHIVFGVTDEGAAAELKARLAGTVPDNSVTVFPVEDTGRESFWHSVLEDLARMRPGLFVLDNVIGALAPGEDISDPSAAARFMRSVRPISSAGIPTLLVTHTPKGTAEGMTVASSPIGGRQFGAAARSLITLRNSGKKGRRIQTAINRAREELDLKVAVRRPTADSEVPLWEREETRPNVVPLREAKPWHLDLADRIVREQPTETTIKGLAHKYAQDVGRKPDTIRPKLTEVLTRSDDRWVRKPSKAA
ncbi:AAA family ATPase [Streptomyces sp. ME02-6978a]|uniref:AAA family ATPase n=1 Tax=unclassified Streptomyces TaxID=2593676 RepID=UPI0029A7A838|nr:MULTISPECIES: AAA family ATPase [unclassified Streptomyces]MDX3090992.1 AAA family ATPase [Streptomyces sp. ME12-02E]MDX3334490.1 AAA family ATPase [Streptomyces sp. ME02-6978a]